MKQRVKKSRNKENVEKNKEAYKRASSHSVITVLCLVFALRITKSNYRMKYSLQLSGWG